MMNFWLSKVFIPISLLFLSGFQVFDAKECTNTPTQIPTKTLMYELLTSKNETWKEEAMSHGTHFHLTPTEESAWTGLFPKMKLTEEEDEFNWNAMYKKIKFFDNNKLDGRNFLKEVSLHNVRLDPTSLHGQAQETNLEYLLVLNVDRLVWSFRKTAGLPTSGAPYGGWEAPESELRGHFVGHYLSATAKMWASTHNEALKQKMNPLVYSLKECQDKLGTGYLSAFPSIFFDRFEAMRRVWAPYYTIHKIMAGLLDQYELAGNSEALKMVIWMADYFYRRVQNVIKRFTIERHWLSLNEETGGMNDVLYQLFRVTGDRKHLILAHLFDNPCFLGLLAMKADDISGFHANTHIPIVVGAQTRYELTGDELYKEIGIFFLDVVNSSHTFATGGTSAYEFWNDPKRLGDMLGSEDEESCTTCNMLKVSRNLFRWTRKVTYADYYERALTNGVLSIQRGKEPGVMIYMLPLGHGVSKGKSQLGWGTPFDSFWCCYGTGIESFSKLGDSIYFEEVGSVPEFYVIQYISSSLNWTSEGMLLTQHVDDVVSWDKGLKVRITISMKKGSRMATLNFRIPSWTSTSGLNASLNGNSLSLPNPGNFLSISKIWENGDQITLELPLSLRTEVIQDDRSEFATLQAILYGPYLLAGLSNGDYDLETGPVESTSEWITPTQPDSNSFLVSLSQKTQQSELFFLSNQNHLIQMRRSPRSGAHYEYSSLSVHATFRLILMDKDSGKPQTPTGLIGKWVILEPFDLPGSLVSWHSHNERVTVMKHNNDMYSTEQLFLIVKGLNGQNGTISLKTKADCFVYSEINGNNSGLGVKLGCGQARLDDDAFMEAASFVWNEGLKKYHPVSFVAKGLRRSYVLEPILEFRDESYNVYFNITQ